MPSRMLAWTPAHFKKGFLLPVCHPLAPDSVIVYVSFILSQLTLNFLSLCLPSTVSPLNGGIIALRLKSALS